MTPREEDRPTTASGPRALLLGTVLIASLALFVRPVTDTDFWFHLAAGRWIVEHGRLPGHDLFTYTVPDHRWVAHEYLSEVLIWFLQSHLGTAGVSVAFGLLTWLGFLLVVAACRPLRQPYVVVGLATALAALAGEPVWGARPQMVTFVFASLVLLGLRRALEAPEGPGFGLLWLPALMVLWSNLHGGWPIGLLFIALAGVAETLRWLGDRSPSHVARLRHLAVVGVLSVLAVGINPNGPAIYAYPFQTLTSTAQQNLIGEWASPDFHLTALRAFELMAGLLVVGMALGRPGVFDLLVALAGLAMAVESVRHIAIFVAAATPVLVTIWSDVWRRHGRPRLAITRGAFPARRERLLVAVALIAVAAAIVPRVEADLARQPELTSQVVPVGAAGWLAAHPDVGERMFNEYNWGGYLADRFFPDPRRAVFIVQEGMLMGDAQIFRYRAVATLEPGWQQVLDQAGVDYVVFDRGSALDDVLATEADWRLVYRDGTAVIYVRR